MKNILLLSIFTVLISCMNQESKVKKISNEDGERYEISDFWSDTSDFETINYTFAITDNSPLEITSESDNPIDIEVINLRTKNVKVSFRGKKSYQNVQLPLDNYKLKIFPVEQKATSYKISIKGPKYHPLPMK
jgi:hypothetical protein